MLSASTLLGLRVERIAEMLGACRDRNCGKEAVVAELRKLASLAPAVPVNPEPPKLEVSVKGWRRLCAACLTREQAKILGYHPVTTGYSRDEVGMLLAAARTLGCAAIPVVEGEGWFISLWRVEDVGEHDCKDIPTFYGTGGDE